MIIPIKRILTLVALIASVNTFSQITITGTVVDSLWRPLPGVTIYELNSNANGTVTGLEGKFSLQVADTSIILFSYVGYYTKAYKAILLKNETIMLFEEVYNYGDELIGPPPSYTLGYWGSNQMLAGIYLAHFRPYVFNTSLYLSTILQYKTDFNQQHDLFFRLNYFNAFNTNISIRIQYQNRNIHIDNKNVSFEDYQVDITGRIYSSSRYRLYGSIGLIHRTKQNEIFWVPKLSINQTLSKHDITINTDISYYDNSFEFSVRPSYKIATWWRIGAHYNKYIEYDEITFRLTRTF